MARPPVNSSPSRQWLALPSMARPPVNNCFYITYTLFIIYNLSRRCPVFFASVPTRAISETGSPFAAAGCVCGPGANAVAFSRYCTLCFLYVLLPPARFIGNLAYVIFSGCCVPSGLPGRLPPLLIDYGCRAITANFFCCILFPSLTVIFFGGGVCVCGGGCTVHGCQCASAVLWVC